MNVDVAIVMYVGGET